LHPSWSLEIAGSGIAGHQFLKELSEELGINDCVQFLGFRSDIDTVMRQSAIFVLSSRIEGFGMVLLEAMSQGCACVSFDCKSGPSDIIAHEVDGLLVPDQDLDEMVTALTRLMRSKDERRKLSRAAREKARSYSVDLIVDRWIALFRELGIPAGAIVSHPNAAQRPPVCVKEKGSH
jgi:glycosyltransferase involved in cell wall biosynthesis